ncbi:MAG: bifunctional 2-polyprenyl-6-hydroxyphenol methylase/3-demethylubiquinol 3-O-methyltransferase UbiG [Hyphomicrobium sp.]|jgi:2-polyprenyl-6-hydroxyphenyl methylase / 3-demethylubiquinone-9 3-methyltransferase
MPPDAPSPARNLDDAEVERFRRIASEWWDAKGKFRPLHQLAPARLTFVRDELVRHFGLTNPGLKPLKGLRVLDVGCGGGLVSEPLARMGARVVGLDPGRENVEAARAHVEGQTGSGGLDLTYRVGMVEELAAEGLQFDAVVSLEVVEHVPDVGAFVKTCASLVRPGGALVLSTINRNLKSYALAIVAAEYVLGWLPRGTHQWDRFVTPEELARFVTAAGMGSPTFKGIVYDPLKDTWSLSDDTDVNYLCFADRKLVE